MTKLYADPCSVSDWVLRSLIFSHKKNKHKSNLRWICIELCHHHGVLFVPNLRLLLHWENIEGTKGEVNLHAILHHFLIVLLL